MIYMFTQIGRLEELEDWKLTSKTNLQIGTNDFLTLDKGYLRLLSGLRRLKGLNLRVFQNIELGIKEAEWMLKHWKSLIHVEVYDGKPGHTNDGSEWRIGPAMATLQARRPWISISRHYQYV